MEISYYDRYHMPFLVVSKNQAKSLRRALRQAEGLPARGVTIGPCTWTFVPPEACELDEDGDPLPTPGWTTECVGEGDEAGGQVAIEVPVELEKYTGKKIGKVNIPSVSPESDLPAAIKALREGRKASEIGAVIGKLKESVRG